PVAVVVHTVTRLRIAAGKRDACDFPAVAHDGTGVANASLTGRARRAAARVAVIDDTIAVVIESVARFGRGEHRPDAIAPPSGPTGANPIGADADVTRLDRTRVAVFVGAGDALTALVNHPVAVVVDPVAHLRRWGAACVGIAGGVFHGDVLFE